MKKLQLLVLLALVALFSACGGGSGSGNGGNTTPSLQSISISGGSTSLAIGMSQQLSATGHYSDGSTKDLTNSATWNSSPSGQVSSTGLFTAKVKGNATVTAASGGVSGTLGLTVTNPLVSISITPANPSIALGLKQAFTALGMFADHTQQDLTATATWASSNPAVAGIVAGA
jgi:hypothetical protein